MKFDRAKMEDVHYRIKKVDMDHFPDTMKELFLSAISLRTYEQQIYQVFAQTVYSEFPVMLRNAGRYSKPQQFEEIKEQLHKAGTPEEKMVFTDILANRENIFQREGKKFYDWFQAIVKVVRENGGIIEKNCRKDLTFGIFFYGKIEDSLRVRGDQIAKMAEVIKNVYVEPMQALKDKIKAYNAEIDTYLDPNKAFERFMKALPSANEFADLTKFIDSKADGKIQAMKAAYSAALSGIEYIGTKIINLENMEERRKLQEELDELRRQYEKYRKQYENVVDEYDKVKNLLVFMDDLKYFSDYVKHFSNQAAEELSQLEQALAGRDAAAFHTCLERMEKEYSVFWK